MPRMNVTGLLSSSKRPFSQRNTSLMCNDLA